MSAVRDERGAVAVMVSVTVVVLFGVAALSVDLGNAWARKRAIQKQADLSVLSAAHLLPTTDTNSATIAAEVARYLAENLATGQAGAISGEQLLNDVESDGEIHFLSSAGDPCTVGCPRMRVVTPSARVEFGLAGVLGQSGTDLQRSASVEVYSAVPDGPSLVPFWLPSGCALGPAFMDASGGNPGKLTDDALPSDVTQGEHGIQGPPSPPGTGPGATVDVSNLRLVSIPPNIDRASIRFVAPDGTWHDYAVTDVGKTDPLVVPAFNVGTEVTDVAGEWRIYGIVQEKGAKSLPQISKDHLTFTVGPSSTESSTTTEATEATPVPVGCVGQQRGNFGQLDSPRQDVSGTNGRLAANIAMGLDHFLEPFVFAPDQAETKDCGKSGSYIVGAKPDDQPLDGRNCIRGDTGNDVPALTAGFLTGVPDLSAEGRISADRGTTTCPERDDVSHGGVVVNNDVLSCFLRGGATLATISQPAGVDSTMLDPAVVDSPRFVWLPVVYAADRAQKNFQPIREFVPAFITDETQLSTATSSDATGDNGVVLNGSGQVKSIQVFVFNKLALPIDERSPTVAYRDSLGQKIGRLID